jgi:hypothetical protein
VCAKVRKGRAKQAIVTTELAALGTGVNLNKSSLHMCAFLQVQVHTCMFTHISYNMIVTYILTSHTCTACENKDT